MSLFHLLIILAVLALLWYAASRWLSGVPRSAALIVIAIVAVYYVLASLGLIGDLQSLMVPQIK